MKEILKYPQLYLLSCGCDVFSFPKTCEGGFTQSVFLIHVSRRGIECPCPANTHTRTHAACIFNITEHVELVFHSDSYIRAALC